MSGVSAREVLERLFAVVINEAEKNEAFAAKLLQAFPEAIIVARVKPKPAVRKAFDASQLHAINILRAHGEPVLRGKLEQLRSTEQLKAVAKASGLVLSGGAARTKASRAELIDGIIAAAKHYDAQRRAAAA
jgi:hypothetical protein